MGLGNKDIVHGLSLSGQTVVVPDGHTLAQLERKGISRGNVVGAEVGAKATATAEVATKVGAVNKTFMEVLQGAEARTPPAEPKNKLGDLGPEDARLYTLFPRG